LNKNRLDRIVNGEVEESDLLFEKNLFMVNVFPGISEEDLLPLSGAITCNEAINSSKEASKSGAIIWPLPGDNKVGEVFISLNGKHLEKQINSRHEAVTSYYVLSLAAVEDYLNHFPEHSAEILKYIDNNEE
jgi:hypothetical protein